MKSTRSNLISILAVAGTIAVFFCTAAFAGSPNCEQKNDRRKALKDEITKELGLTEEQQAQLGEARKANQEAVKGLLESLKTARTGLREELAKYDSDPAKVQALAATVKDIQNKMIDQRIASVSKIKTVLTAEQFGKLQEKSKTIMEKRKKGGREHKRFRQEEIS